MTIEKRIKAHRELIDRIETGLNALDSALAEYGDILLASANLIPKVKPAREPKPESAELAKVDERVEAFNAKRNAWAGTLR